MSVKLATVNTTMNDTQDTIEIATIATAAVTVDLRISLWAGRKRDKKTTKEVNDSKNAQSRAAASVIKNLMADDGELDKIRAYGQETRIWLHQRTMPWNDMGMRLLPTALVFETVNELDVRVAEFDKMVVTFLANYPHKITGAALKLGDLFDRSEFPKPEEVAHKFSMMYTLAPVPTQGDFRVDIQKDMGTFLKDHYKKRAEQRIVAAMQEPWERVYESLVHAKERIDAVIEYSAVEEKGDRRRAPKLYQSIIDNAMETALMVEKLNITNDPKLKDCATRMRMLFSGLNIEAVRSDSAAQVSAKQKLDDMLSAFDFSFVAPKEESDD